MAGYVAEERQKTSAKAMTCYVAEELQKTSATSSAADLDWTRDNSVESDFPSVTAVSSAADLLKTTPSSSELPPLVQLPLASQVPETRYDVPIEQTAADAVMRSVSYSARERRSECDLTVAKESVASGTDLEQITDGQDGRPAWRLLNDALVSYRTGWLPQTSALDPTGSEHPTACTGCGQGGVANRHRHLALGTPKLPPPRPPPFKGSGASPMSTADSPNLPAGGSLEAASRPNTSGGAYVRPHLRPGNQIRRPETSPSVGAQQSRRRSSVGSCNSGSKSSISGELTKRGAKQPKPHNIMLKPIFGLYEKAGRMGRKAYAITQNGPKSCDLAKSCRKHTVCDQNMRRQEEHRFASAQSKTFESQQVAKRLQQLKSMTEGDEGLSPRSQRSARGTWGSSSADQAQHKKHRTQNQSRHSTRQKMEDLSTFQAFDLANAWNLPAGQVTRAWQCFKRYDTDDDGLLSPDEFQMLLRSVLRESFASAKDVPRRLFKRVEELRSESQAANFFEFLTWVTQNSFSEDVLADTEQRFIRRMARKLGAPVVEIEHVKRHFDSFDTDGSGQIEYDEFCNLLGKLLNLPDMSALPESRIKSFWREVDEDGSGVIEFHEFVPWYVGYFGGLQSETPLVNFYRKVRPNPFRDQF
eukprot:TRINITY_DN25074_c1_g2_i1.p1 TRINITY_DN25074_c1_g2~~TRINITY_DN25074_c1_g2_i1.p1  ORF type:complete len:642 (-),score=92.34 TRINITY_DN25074_c1_g2_i1:201-2126(-)